LQKIYHADEVEREMNLLEASIEEEEANEEDI
jgi:hypothetical protein